MKTLRATLLLASFSGGFSLVGAQTPQPLPPVAANAAPAPDGILMTAEQLEQLLGPIALYPDALIALILPACTASTDIVLAARQLRENPSDRSQIEHRGWDESVKSLTSYPEVLTWLDENLSWTKQVGEAFVEQPAEVMQAVQRLRAKARAAGTLVDTPQQQVIAESSTIRIVPAQPEVIYVPYYEPEVVFVSTPVYHSRPVLAFGSGVAVGSWLAYDCDWQRRVIWCGDRRRPWHGHDWRRPVVSYAPPASTRVSITVRQWRPPPIHTRPVRPPSFTYRHTHIVRPEPIGRPSGFTHFPHTPRPTGPRPGGSSFVANPSPRVEPTPSPAPQQPRVYTRDRDGNRDRSSSRPGSSPRVVEGPQYTPPAPAAGAPQVQPQPQPRVYTQPRSRGSNPGQTAYTSPSPSTNVVASPAPSYTPSARQHDRGSSPSFAARSSSRVQSTPTVGPVQAPSTTPSAPQPSVSTTPPPQQRSGDNNSSSRGNSNGSSGGGRGRDWRTNER